MSPETQAHIDRLFSGQSSAGAAPSVAPRPGGLATAVKGLPGGVVLGDLANSTRNLAQGKTNLGGIEHEQLARQGIGGYLSNVARNLTSPGNSLLSYFGAGGHPEAAAGGALTGPVARAGGANLASSIRFNQASPARRSIWQGLDADAGRHTQNLAQTRTQADELQKRIAALTTHRQSLTRDPGAAFSSQFAKQLPTAAATAATSPLGSAYMATQEAPGFLGRLGQLAAAGAPLTSRLTAPATAALVKARQFNQARLPARQELTRQMQPLQQGMATAQSRIADLTKMLAGVRAQQADYNLAPLSRAWQNTVNMFSPKAQTSY